MEYQGLQPCMVAPTKNIVGLGWSLGIDTLETSGTTSDYRTLLSNKTIAIAKALVALLISPFNVFVFCKEEEKLGFVGGYNLAFLHIKAQ